MAAIISREDRYVVFQALGNAFDTTIDLHALEKLLPEYRRLLDIAYRHITNSDVIKNRVRQVRYQTAFEIGCLDIVVDIAPKAAPLAAALLTTDNNAYQIAKMSFQLISKVIELRKKISEIFETSRKPAGFSMNMESASLSDSLVFPINTLGNGNTIHVAPIVFFAAQASQQTVNRLARAIDNDLIREVNLQHAGVMGQSLTSTDRKIAEGLNFLSDQIVTLQGEIYEVNYEAKTARISVGESKYPATWPGEILDQIAAVAGKGEALLKVNPIIDFKGISSEPVKFHIKSCQLGQLRI